MKEIYTDVLVGGTALTIIVIMAHIILITDT